MRWIRSIKVSFIAVSVVLIALGLWLLICPGVSSAAICVALGAVSVLYGTIKLLGYFSNDLYRLAFQFVFFADGHWRIYSGRQYPEIPDFH